MFSANTQGGEPLIPHLRRPGSVADAAELSIVSGTSQKIQVPGRPAEWPPRDVNRELVESNLRSIYPQLLRLAEQIETELRRAVRDLDPPFSIPVFVEHLSLASDPQGIRRPIEGTVTFEGDEVVAEFPEYGLVASGSSRDAALEAVAQQLDELAADYLSLSDDQLTPGGVEYRNKLRALLGR